MPSTQEIAKEKRITWNEACYLQELQQGKNIIDSAARVADQGQLERLVLSSLADAKKASKGKYTWVYHFDGKAHFVQYLEEQAKSSPQYQTLFEKTSYLQVGNYLDNWSKNPIFAPKKVGSSQSLLIYVLQAPRMTTAQLFSDTSRQIYQRKPVCTQHHLCTRQLILVHSLKLSF
jgi:hypothetical protein